LNETKINRDNTQKILEITNFNLKGNDTEIIIDHKKAIEKAEVNKI
jgi:hypothetical protein